MLERFANPQSSEVQHAIARLGETIPLGSTDIVRILSTGIGQFPADTSRPKHLIYIGDGMSRANILQTEEYIDGKRFWGSGENDDGGTPENQRIVAEGSLGGKVEVACGIHSLWEGSARSGAGSDNGTA